MSINENFRCCDDALVVGDNLLSPVLHTHRNMDKNARRIHMEAFGSRDPRQPSMPITIRTNAQGRHAGSPSGGLTIPSGLGRSGLPYVQSCPPRAPVIGSLPTPSMLFNRMPRLSLPPPSPGVAAGGQMCDHAAELENLGSRNSGGHER